MHDYIELEINQIKNLTNLRLELPLEKGLYAVVGTNGSGKSTLMLALSQLIRKSSLSKLSSLDYNQNSFVKFKFDGREDCWVYSQGFKRWEVKSHPSEIRLPGFYEGSIFYGTRFSDASIAESVLPELIQKNHIVDADSFIIEKLSIILHGDKEHYKKLKRIRNRKIADSFGFKGVPYFYETSRGIISQLAMSSGECMLITLLHFVYNVIIRGKISKDTKLIFLIDEVELAIHPGAINRLVSFMEELIREYNLTTVFSSHSAEIIRRINPRNIFQIENDEGNITINNPCYPSYAIRDLYVQDGFDYLILVEDKLAKKFVDRIILMNDLFCSKLIYVLPAGDWFSNLRLHSDLAKNNILGVGKKIISVLDGDIIEQANTKDEYKGLPKLFLPIKSVEKYLYSKIIRENDRAFIKYIGDKYFRVRGLAEIISDYRQNFEVEKDKNGKKLYDVLISNLNKNAILEDDFLTYFCDDLIKLLNTNKFKSQLEALL
ncbi:AAA family ATPase [Propionispora vibrioides]|uniref:AAA domain-containing protein, putative AbiEii toxin, Type IV TA system n=1 Tax=Propionispora vibrioides TaxID=112903 RepID=A0A1H8Y4A1_9FIRM|nr:AAA family ATPase [Propionispora vibrioides]SEP46811.1 AAA domain-containing protein, putative AbiEii toxin, Type IV TA system [Propionispora vibrioides]